MRVRIRACGSEGVQSREPSDEGRGIAGTEGVCDDDAEDVDNECEAFIWGTFEDEAEVDDDCLTMWIELVEPEAEAEAADVDGPG